MASRVYLGEREPIGGGPQNTEKPALEDTREARDPGKWALVTGKSGATLSPGKVKEVAICASPNGFQILRDIQEEGEIEEDVAEEDEDEEEVGEEITNFALEDAS
ncbi:hypothetical protein F2Q70_00017312 [Brassica cretica]|uniref:Uncharacterized protein n=1 Tax=Brassica cretica TaxID=69181 RepID=A0A8S9I004_BRACR|nr:hypothetical protein F2Q70_00017312 [Brassica cretica]